MFIGSQNHLADFDWAKGNQNLLKQEKTRKNKKKQEKNVLYSFTVQCRLCLWRKMSVLYLAGVK